MHRCPLSPTKTNKKYPKVSGPSVATSQEALALVIILPGLEATPHLRPF